MPSPSPLSLLQGQLERFAATVQQAEGDHASLQQAADALRAEQQQLAARGQEAEAEAQQLARLAESLRSSNTALEAQLAAARAAAKQAGAEQAELAAALAAARGEREELAAAVRQLGEQKEGLEGAVARLGDQLRQSNEVLDSARRCLGDCVSARWAVSWEASAATSNGVPPLCQHHACAPIAWPPLAQSSTCSPVASSGRRRSAADGRAVSLQEILRSVRAELLLKDASIKALTRENAQRAERLRALQALIDSLTQQGNLDAVGPSPTHVQARLACLGLAQASPAASSGRPGSGGAAPSWASGSGGGRPGAALADPPPRSPSAAQQFTPSPPTAQHFTFASPPPSYMPLQTSPPQQAASWQQRSDAGSQHSASAPASAGSTARAPAASPPSGGAPSGAAVDVPASPLQQQLLPPRALSPGAAGDLSDSRLSFLLELVVAKRISAAQAQQVRRWRGEGSGQHWEGRASAMLLEGCCASSARPRPAHAALQLMLPFPPACCPLPQAINSAAEGDVRPLLQVLDAVRRRIGQQGPGGAAAAAPAAIPLTPLAAAASPVSAAELAAVRRQIQELQQRAAT